MGMDVGGGVKNKENLLDVLYVRPLTVAMAVRFTYNFCLMTKHNFLI